MKLLAVVVMLTSMGCSVALQHKPRHASATCSSSRRLPWIDVGFVAAETAAAGVGIALANGIGFDQDEDTGTVVAGVALLAGVLQLASGMNGFESAAQCRTGVAPNVAAR